MLFFRVGVVKDVSGLDFFVGVEAAYDDVEAIKALVDRVKSYTNLFVIGSTGITFNVTKLDGVCQYIYESGLYFLVYMHLTIRSSYSEWIDAARFRWGDRFLGLYAGDEVGGRQIDCGPYRLVSSADNITHAGELYVETLNESLRHFREYYMHTGDLPLFTADYALYWFDYEGGYDTVLVEFGWNHSRLFHMALCRGAAEIRNREWGVIVTWTYNNPPYIESGGELFEDLVLAYNSGARYVVVFNYPKMLDYGILGDEHFEALEKFWNYINNNQPTLSEIGDRVAYVLPENYGSGFRQRADCKLWGLWQSDGFANETCREVAELLMDYGSELDILYEDCYKFPPVNEYKKLIYWNGTVISNTIR